MDKFVHLHVHGHHSLLDGLNTPRELVQAAKRFGQTHIALTDHGSLSGHRDLQAAAAQEGITPILGVEAYISPTDRFDRRSNAKRADGTSIYNHIILLAKDQDGLENLHHMSREAWQTGYYHKPRIDLELLEEYGDGIIVLSGCMNGLIAKAFERGDHEAAKRVMGRLRDRFGEDFYVEVQPHNPVELNDYLLDIADKYGVGAVATTDCHYANEDDRAIEDALLILSTSPKYDKDQNYESTQHIKDLIARFNVLYPDRTMTFQDIDVHMMDRLNVQERMREQNITREDIYDNTVEIAQKIGKYNYPTGLDLLPDVDSQADATLREKVQAGLRARGVESVREYQQRAAEELAVLERKQFAPYFLIVEDAIKWATNEGILVGPGRGSAAGSLVCYALGITDIDPLKHGLLFFRFIDESRDDWPDIDVDFQKSRREEVKEYIRHKYGHVASITNFVYFKDKSAIRAAARVFRVPVNVVNKAMKKVDTFDDFVNSSIDEVVNLREKYPEVRWLAERLQGRIQQVSLHAAGMITSREPIENFAPMETRDNPDGDGRIPVVALDMEQVADIGLIKLDFLGLNTLDVIADALELIKQRHGKTFNLWSGIPFNDKQVLKELERGHTTGVFQADATPYRNLLVEMGVDSFDDLVASNALVRPGAKNTVGDVFIRRKKGYEQVRFPHDKLAEFLADTYGTIVYQEQVMQTATELGGLSHSEANKMRKIIGKKRDAREFDAFRDKFVTGASKFIDRQLAEKLWQDFEAHAGYSFNKSHAVAYSVVSYWTAWLKMYYPLEFMCALYRNEGDKDKKTEHLIEMKRLGIKVLLPHITKSDALMTIEDDALRIGLTDIKYISYKVYNNLREYAPYRSYADLQEAAGTKYSGISSRTLEALNAVGAASFADNPKTGDEPKNYYEYLNIPKFDFYDLPADVYDLITPIEDYDEEDTFVIKAMVKGIKRGKGWARIELVDETGTCGVFMDENTPIEPGRLYMLLVAWNRIIKYIPVEEVMDQQDDPFVHYLLADKIEVSSPTAGYIVAGEKRWTKARKLMGSIVISNADKELKRILVFPNVFGKVYNRIKPGQVKEVAVRRLDDGGLCLLEVK